MRYSFYDHFSSPMQLLFVILIMLLSFVAGTVGSTLLLLPLTGLSLESFFQSLSDFSTPSGLWLIRIFQVVQSLFLFVVPALLIAFLFSAQRGRYLSLRAPASPKIWLAAGLLTFLAFPAINAASALNEALQLPESWSAIEKWMKSAEEAARIVTEKFVLDRRLSIFGFNLFMMALLPALGEEFLFRGVLQKIFTRWTGNVHAGIWITGILFSAIHLQFYGFLPRALLGVLFGYLLVWSGSIWAAVFAHFVNNAFSVLFYFLIARGYFTMQESEFGGGANEWAFALVSLVLAALVAKYIWQQSRKGGENQEIAAEV